MLLTLVKQMRTAIVLLALFTVLTGIVYPCLVTGLAQLLFPWKANGSLIEQDGKVIGSKLIGQAFSDPAYFWGRPSETSPYPYNALNSSGSNMGPSNPIFLETVKKRVELLRLANLKMLPLVPVDLVTASASGLDPDISPMAAFYQVERIANARKMMPESIRMLIRDTITRRTFGILGESRINVLQLNLALDTLQNKR
ncbi:MAG: potassium-transporting ATPase subunit KdpC [Gammaproteobacteria bacterium]